MEWFSSHCPKCDSEDITMIWDSEYNDMWVCDDCKNEFWVFIQREYEIRN